MSIMTYAGLVNKHNNKLPNKAAALELLRAMTDGERASPWFAVALAVLRALSSADVRAFWKLAKAAPYVLACVLYTQFSMVQAHGLALAAKAYGEACFVRPWSRAVGGEGPLYTQVSGVQAHGLALAAKAYGAPYCSVVCRVTGAALAPLVMPPPPPRTGAPTVRRALPPPNGARDGGAKRPHALRVLCAAAQTARLTPRATWCPAPPSRPLWTWGPKPSGPRPATWELSSTARRTSRKSGAPRNPRVACSGTLQHAASRREPNARCCAAICCAWGSAVPRWRRGRCRASGLSRQAPLALHHTAAGVATPRRYLRFAGSKP